MEAQEIITGIDAMPEDTEAMRVLTILAALTAFVDDNVPAIPKAKHREILENKIVEICGRW